MEGREGETETEKEAERGGGGDGDDVVVNAWRLLSQKQKSKPKTKNATNKQSTKQTVNSFFYSCFMFLWYPRRLGSMKKVSWKWYTSFVH